MQTSANWAELLEPGLNDIFTESGKKLPDYLKTLFNVRKSKKAAEHSLGRGGIGMMQPWASSGNTVNYDSIAKGHPVNWTHEKYSNGLQIERELWDDDLMEEIESETNDLAFSVYYTRQYQAASVFNNAFNGAYTGPDGFALCYAAHTLVPGGPALDNAGTYELNATNVEIVRNLMKGWTDDRGNIIPCNPDTLLVPPNLRKAAMVIADSPKEPDVADNNVNVWKGTLKVIEWDMLTDTNNWFMLDMEKCKRYLLWWDRRTAKIQQDGDNFDTEVARYKVVARWSYGWKAPTFVYGNLVA